MTLSRAICSAAFQQLRQWLDQVANARVHATTRRVVTEHFAEERPKVQQLPGGPFQVVLRLERLITRDGMVSVDGNLYSVPNSARRHPVEVHSTTGEIRIFERTGSSLCIPSWMDVAGDASRKAIVVCRRPGQQSYATRGSSIASPRRDRCATSCATSGRSSRRRSSCASRRRLAARRKSTVAEELTIRETRRITFPGVL
jgi:hypothetical protein